MAAITRNIRLLISGRSMDWEYKTVNKPIHLYAWSPWGASFDSVERIYPPFSGYIPVGSNGASYSIHLLKETASITHNMEGGHYKFNIHQGTSWMNLGELSATLYGQFKRGILRWKNKTIYQVISVDKTQDKYKLLFNCSDFASVGWSEIDASFEYMTGDKELQIKLTDSVTDPNATTKGTFLWARFQDYDPPKIQNVKPENGSVTISIRPEISADFNDFSGSGVDLASFKMVIDEGTPNRIEVNANTKKIDGMIKISENGFTYKLPIDLPSTVHNFFITIADKSANVNTQYFSFVVDFKSFNPAIGNFPVENLEHLGTKAKTKYNAIGINTIGDLVNQDPVYLSNTIGIKLATCIDNVKRARIVCSEVKFQKGDFGELFSYSIRALSKMTDSEILNLDITAEEPEQLAKLRDNIALLYVCFDDSVLINIKFGDLVWDQPG